ncbi:MAG TPA: hypothetical protein GXZ91_08160 [Christensenellaceae bacterium]|jgi:acetyltransferase-like isoleucine patch superfamily enzyme|nr:hypothetical protein [Christensenellaceae bacterium]
MTSNRSKDRKGLRWQGSVAINNGSQIIQGLTIGENTIVGAGAVVVRDLPANCTAVGVPAQVIKVGN